MKTTNDWETERQNVELLVAGVVVNKVSNGSGHRDRDRASPRFQ